ncbi:unnamed protein product [Moneuplotes crassus]|uniref:Uncharacterized protein n=1 Tax=Euplotes crassus TaxID=5936 RepID=A0AAD1X4U1_EUPCR|nr:unnamed protein product [Moneuplotes crassus]
MGEQVKVFFKQKFQEVQAVKERERDFRRRKKVESVKKQARLQKGHRGEVEMEREEKFEEAAREFRRLKKEFREMEREVGDGKGERRGRRGSQPMLVSFTDVPLDDINCYLAPFEDTHNPFENIDLLKDLKGFERLQKKSPIKKIMEDGICHRTITIPGSMTTKASLEPSKINLKQLLKELQKQSKRPKQLSQSNQANPSPTPPLHSKPSVPKIPAKIPTPSHNFSLRRRDLFFLQNL